MGRGATVFELLHGLVSKILGVSDEEVLDILKHRLASMRNAGKFSEVLLQIEEAVGCLDENDRQVAAEAEEVRVKCVKEYGQKREAVRKAGSGGSRKKKTQKSMASLLGYSGPAVMPPPSTIDHASTKKYLPPQALIWRSNGSGTWSMKLEPFAQVSRSWAKYGEHEALRLCVASGLVQGVFEEMLFPGGSAAGASASPGGH